MIFSNKLVDTLQRRRRDHLAERATFLDEESTFSRVRAVRRRGVDLAPRGRFARARRISELRFFVWY
jgi:hypothetical protein